MKITSIRIKKLIDSSTKLKAVANVTLDDAFAVDDIKILQSEEGLFLAMPSRKLNDGKFTDIAHPINRETRKAFEKLLFGGYDFILKPECVSIDMTLDNSECENLYEQKPSDFSVNILY